MPYSSAHLLINYHGELPGGEEWSVGFRTIAAQPDPSELQTYAQYAADCWQISANIANGFNAMNPVGVTMTGCTVRQIDINGKTVTVAEAAPQAPSGGTVANPQCPNQTAVTVSLLTAKAGRSYRGRVYLPVLAPGTLTSFGRISGGDVTFLGQFMTALTGLLVGVAGVVNPPAVAPAALFRLAVQSKTSGQPAAPITSCKIGDVMDTQRRRRDKLIEAYTTFPVPPPVA